MNKKVFIPILLLTIPVFLSGCGRSGTPTAASSKPEGEHGEDAKRSEEKGIALTATQIKASNITLAQAGAAKIRQTLPLYGTVAPNAERVREVTARYPGIIRGVAKRVGDPVREGETLATVESNESLRVYQVTAPLSGVVTQRKANPGEYSAEAALFTVADLSTVWVELSIFPRDVAKVRIGQSVRVKSPDSGLSADGKVVYVAPFGQTANQTLTARVLLNNPTRQWAPGLYVTAEVTLTETEVGLAIRNEALQTLGGQSVVFVKDKEGFSPESITVGRSDSEFSEVLSGLQPGQVYAATSSFILKAELGKGEAAHED